MQIFTQIVLNQEEIEEAIKAFVVSQVGATANQSIEVELKEPRTSDSEFTANVSLSTDGAGQLQAKVTATSAPTTPKTRTRRTAAQIAADNAAADVKEDETQITEEQAAEAAEEQAPWVDPDAGTEVIQETEQAQPNEVQASAPLKIFPDLTSSAAPSAPKPAADPAVAAKSLFANLTKPTQ